jgi:CRP/FNR family transcriptional regulator, cyclic AMP receptor protein
VLVEGDRDSREVYVLLQGAVKVVSNTADGTAVLLSIRADGDLIGELASLDGSPRLASVVTIRPCTVRRIGQQAFLDFLRTHPGTSLAVSRSVSAKLRNATWHRVEYGSTPVPIRLARLLILLATQHGEATADGTSIHLSLAQTELAALVGAREPTVQRVLRALRRDGVIGIGYRRIVVYDRAALREAAGISEIPAEYGVRSALRWDEPGD